MHRWEDYITSTIDLKEIRVIVKNWIDLAQNRDYQRALGIATLNLRVLKYMNLIGWLVDWSILLLLLLKVVCHPLWVFASST